MTVVVVTRPAREAQAWVKRLKDAGWDARPLPLIDIGDAPDPASLRQARQALCSYDAAMFVSAQAVERFCAGFSWPGCPATRVWAPGPGTAAALLRQGVPADRVDQPAPDAAQFDSEALWAVVAPQVRPGHRLLVVRGATMDSPNGNVREWLASQCRAAGGEIDWCVAYARRAPVWGVKERAQAVEWSGPQAIWLFSSTEAVNHLATLCPGIDWRGARALATHQRIADTARDLGFGDVRTTRPAVAEVLHALESVS